MADDELHSTSSIDDAIRQAERKLEQRIEELRSMAGPGASPRPARAATLAPPRGSRAPATVLGSSSSDEAGHEGDASTPAASGVADDVDPFDALVEDDDDTSATDVVAAAPDADEDWTSGSDDLTTVPADGPRSGGSSWTDAVLRPVQPADRDDREELSTRGVSFVDEPWRSDADGAVSGARRARPGATQPSADETEFWAQTRTAMRLLQQSTDQLRIDLPSDVSRRVQDAVSRELSGRLAQQLGASVNEDVERIVREELSGPTSSLRALQQELPSVAGQLERAFIDELEGPTAALRQLTDELPTRFERVERTVVDEVGRALHDDITGVEQSVRETASHVERAVIEQSAQLRRGVAEQLERAELATREQGDRVERGVDQQFDRLEAALRDGLGQVEQTVQGELEAPLGSLRQLHEELPVQLERVERSVTEQVRGIGDELRRDLDETAVGVQALRDLDLPNALADVTLAGMATLEKLTALSSDLDHDRLQRSEDLETVVDTMASGWEGVLTAVASLVERTERLGEQTERVAERLERLEQGLGGLSGVQGQLDDHLEIIQTRLLELRPAPVVVTVQHAEAMVEQTTRAGYVRETGGTPVGASSSGEGSTGG